VEPVEDTRREREARFDLFVLPVTGGSCRDAKLLTPYVQDQAANCLVVKSLPAISRSQAVGSLDGSTQSLDTQGQERWPHLPIFYA